MSGRTAPGAAEMSGLADLGHDLRGPLNAILGFGHLLAAEDGLTPDQREFVDQILLGGEHLRALIDALDD